MAHSTNQKKKGASYIEALVASLIIGLCLLAVLSLFGFSMTMIDKTGDEGVAYNLARRTLENARATGFSHLLTPEGTTTTFFDATGGSQSSTQTANHRFRVRRTVTSDRYSDTSTGPRPAADSVRTVVVEVHRVPENSLIERVGTHLVRSGV